MLGLLWRLIVGRFCSCAHSWETLSEGRIMSDEHACGMFYNLRCKKCGEIARRNLYA